MTALRAACSEPLALVPCGVLEERAEHLRSSLQQGVSRYNLEEALQSLTALFDHIVREPIREHLAWQRRDVDARALPLKNVPERLKVAVPAAHDRVPDLECRDVRLKR